ELTEFGVRPPAPATATSARRMAVPAVIAIVAVALVAGWFVKRSADRRMAAREMLPAIERLIERDDYVAAAALAADAERTLGNDPALAALWPRMTDVPPLATDPPGADVAISDTRLQSGW